MVRNGSRPKKYQRIPKEKPEERGDRQRSEGEKNATQEYPRIPKPAESYRRLPKAGG